MIFFWIPHCCSQTISGVHSHGGSASLRGIRGFWSWADRRCFAHSSSLQKEPLNNSICANQGFQQLVPTKRNAQKKCTFRELRTARQAKRVYREGVRFCETFLFLTRRSITPLGVKENLGLGLGDWIFKHLNANWNCWNSGWGNPTSLSSQKYMCLGTCLLFLLVCWKMLEGTCMHMYAYVSMCVRVCVSVCVCAQVHVYMRPACFAARPLPTWIANSISLEARLKYIMPSVSLQLSCLSSFYQPCCHWCSQGCNVRHEHTFVDEDAMGWLKRCMAAHLCCRKGCWIYAALQTTL